ncbi:SWF or SNF family helicase [Streptomyces sp. MUM 203J]|nr:SWF or SNF family helicase [Streptomyces sp. MUM 203J]
MDGPYGDEESTFAAEPPASGRGFADTWWGHAWLKALEDNALEGEPLRKGRARARAGAVGAVSVRPGRITAVVRDRDGGAHRTDVLVQELPDAEWERFLEAAVARAGHVAALLDRDLPPHLVEDAAAAGAELLPGIGDLEPRCGCGAWDHCPHSAALCYQVARILDRDPFVLLLLRGRGERRVMRELNARAAAAAGAGSPEAGPGEALGAVRDERAALGAVRADEAFAARDILPALPDPPPLPTGPGESPPLDTEAGAGADVDPATLELSAAAAASLAHRMLAAALAPDAGSSLLEESELTVRQDAVRLAAAPGASGRALVRLAAGSGRTVLELEDAVRAWRLGGAAALEALEEAWEPDPVADARARAVLAAAWADRDGPAPRAEAGGRWTVMDGGTQLRLDRRGRWWPFRREAGRWVPAGPSDEDPAAALAEVLEGGA